MLVKINFIIGICNAANSESSLKKIDASCADSFVILKRVIYSSMRHCFGNKPAQSFHEFTPDYHAGKIL